MTFGTGLPGRDTLTLYAVAPPDSQYARLTGADRMNLLVERSGVPWHVGMIGVLDGTAFARGGSAASGRETELLLDPVRAALDRALARAPRLGQVVRRTLPGQGPPAWVDAATVDLDRHLRVVPLTDLDGDTGAAAGREALLAAAERVLAQPMDLSRPLWDLTLLPGLPGGEVGMVLRLHHAVADGVAAIRLLSSIFEDPAGAAAGPTGISTLETTAEWPARPERPVKPAPTGRQLAADAWRCRRAALARTPDLRSHLASSRALATQLAATINPPRQLQPRTSLTRPVGHRRRFSVLKLPLEPVRRVARECGGTVNDAVLAAVAGALRTVLVARGEPADLTLRASVPVSLRAAGTAEGDLGNRVGVMLAPLPLGESDPRRRLARIAAATREEKVRARRAGALSVMTTTLGQRLAQPLLRRQRLVSLFVTNVPGPETPLWLAGARLLEAYPVAGIAGNVTLDVGVLSYAGDLALGVVADADAWPDLTVLTGALEESFEAMIG